MVVHWPKGIKTRGELRTQFHHCIDVVPTILDCCGVAEPKAVNGIQHYLMTETRLGIPAIFHNETLSGVVAPGFTHFPTSIALAATWDPAAIEEMATVIRRPPVQSS